MYVNVQTTHVCIYVTQWSPPPCNSFAHLTQKPDRAVQNTYERSRLILCGWQVYNGTKLSETIVTSHTLSATSLPSRRPSSSSSSNGREAMQCEPATPISRAVASLWTCLSVDLSIAWPVSNRRHRFIIFLRAVARRPSSSLRSDDVIFRAISLSLFCQRLSSAQVAVAPSFPPPVRLSFYCT